MQGYPGRKQGPGRGKGTEGERKGKGGKELEKTSERERKGEKGREGKAHAKATPGERELEVEGRRRSGATHF